MDGKTLQIDKVTDDQSGPNGICFSPDFRKLYIADTGTGRDIRVYDVDGKSLRNGKRFIQLDIPGTVLRPRPTASGVTSTATSGPARGRVCRSSRPTAHGSA